MFFRKRITLENRIIYRFIKSKFFKCFLIESVDWLGILLLCPLLPGFRPFGAWTMKTQNVTSSPSGNVRKSCVVPKVQALSIHLPLSFSLFHCSLQWNYYNFNTSSEWTETIECGGGGGGVEGGEVEEGRGKKGAKWMRWAVVGGGKFGTRPGREFYWKYSFPPPLRIVIRKI